MIAVNGLLVVGLEIGRRVGESGKRERIGARTRDVRCRQGTLSGFEGWKCGRGIAAEHTCGGVARPGLALRETEDDEQGCDDLFTS